MALEKILNNISSEETSIDDTWLADLSDTDLSKTTAFSIAWESISEDRRISIIERLIELTKNRIHLSYNYIFKYCLNDVFQTVRQRAICLLYTSPSPRD